MFVRRAVVAPLPSVAVGGRGEVQDRPDAGKINVRLEGKCSSTTGCSRGQPEFAQLPIGTDGGTTIPEHARHRAVVRFTWPSRWKPALRPPPRSSEPRRPRRLGYQGTFGSRLFSDPALPFLIWAAFYIRDAEQSDRRLSVGARRKGGQRGQGEQGLIRMSNLPLWDKETPSTRRTSHRTRMKCRRAAARDVKALASLGTRCGRGRPAREKRPGGG